MSNVVHLPCKKWTKEMDDLLLYMRDYLLCTIFECTGFLQREYPHSHISTYMVRERHERLKQYGRIYTLKESEAV